MPIYEYERPDGSTFEIHQGFHDEPLTQDPDSGAQVRRIFHAPAVHFKGAGFYNTDYGTRKRQRESAATDGSGSSSEGKATSSADNGAAKPATSSDGDGAAKKPGAGADTGAAKKSGADTKSAQTTATS